MQEQRTASFAATVAEQAAVAPGHRWLESARTDRSVSRGELGHITERWRSHDMAGRRVALLADDPVDFGVLFVALIGAGATVLPLDPEAPADATQRLVTNDIEAVVTTVDPASPVAGGRVVRIPRATLVPEAPPAAPARHTSEGGCLLFSSGSTGPRKAVHLSETQLLHVARAVAHAYELGPQDRGYNPLPLFHVNGEVVGLLAPLVSRGTVVLDDRFHRAGFWDLIRCRSVTWVNAVPAIVTILAHDDVNGGPPRRLRFLRSASAPLPEPVLTRFEERYGVPVVESYGMTEAASQITANPLRGHRPGTVGRPIGVELRVVGDDGLEVPDGVIGHVHIRGPGVIGRYANGVGDERFTEEGWLRTGDLGSLDVCGFLTLAGRDGEVINRGGEKIFPREVEDVLSGNPSVRETVVVGRPDPVLGQVPVAYVIPADDRPLDLEHQLSARCADQLPRAHRPAEIRLVGELPRGPAGKPLRRLVAERARS